MRANAIVHDQLPRKVTVRQIKFVNDQLNAFLGKNKIKTWTVESTLRFAMFALEDENEKLKYKPATVVKKWAAIRSNFRIRKIKIFDTHKQEV